MLFYLVNVQPAEGWRGPPPTNPGPERENWRNLDDIVFYLQTDGPELVLCQISKLPDQNEAYLRSWLDKHQIPIVSLFRREVTAAEMDVYMRSSGLVGEDGQLLPYGPMAYVDFICQTVSWEWLADLDKYSTAKAQLSRATRSRCPGLLEELDRLHSDDTRVRDIYAITGGCEDTIRNRLEPVLAARRPRSPLNTGRVAVIRPQVQKLDPKTLNLLYQVQHSAAVMVLFDGDASVDKTLLGTLGAMAAQHSGAVLTVFAFTPKNETMLAPLAAGVMGTPVIRLGFDPQTAQRHQAAVERQAARRKKTTPPPPQRQSSAMDELDRMIGLHQVKQTVHKAVAYSKAQKLILDRGFKALPLSKHMIFMGNPGTAKTSVARLVAKIFYEEGLLSKGTFLEVGRADLVGKYVGWSANQTKSYFKKAEGGVLFIDEAYSLFRGNDDSSDSFGLEVIDCITQEMENRRDGLLVIMAGYPQQMKHLLDANPGLRSRFSHHVLFEDYSEEELFSIFQKILHENDRRIHPHTEEEVRRILANARKQDDFGNGRFCRQLVEHGLMSQALRLAAREPDDVTDDDIRYLLTEDIAGQPMFPVCAEDKDIPTMRPIGFRP